MFQEKLILDSLAGGTQCFNQEGNISPWFFKLGNDIILEFIWLGTDFLGCNIPAWILGSKNCISVFSLDSKGYQTPENILLEWLCGACIFPFLVSLNQKLVISIDLYS